MDGPAETEFCKGVGRPVWAEIGREKDNWSWLKGEGVERGRKEGKKGREGNEKGKSGEWG